MKSDFVRKKIRIGDILLSHGKLTEEQIETALSEQKKSGSRLGKTLISLGMISEKELLTILSEQLSIPFIDLKNYQYNRNDVCSLKETVARRFRIAILKQDIDSLVLAMSDPTDIFCLDEISRIFNKHINPVIVRESELLDFLDNAYGEFEKIASLAEELNDELSDDLVDVDNLTADDIDAPVVKLIQKIFEEAVRFKASDIHIEPDEKVLRIRLRIDGILSEQVVDEKNIANAVVVRLKLMSRLNISEKRLPQDGRFHIRVNQSNVDVRISTLPIQYGESIVMRLLIVDEGVRSLSSLNMPKSINQLFLNVIKEPHGLILVTGPTGSGKTTTLYSAINVLNAPGKKIITVEDPVEYRLPRLNQVQINERIGLDFHSVLRSSLRQDPDVLLIGEIRDATSAEIALRAAMTGHLVFSTLHTNDAISSVLRLIDMGVDEFLVAAALKMVVAQRLVRKLCEHCKEPFSVSPELSYMLTDEQKKHIFYQSVGCVHCFNTGYRGRLGVFECLLMSEAMIEAIRNKSISEFSRLAVNSDSYQKLASSALQLAIEGKTSLEEVQRYSLKAYQGFDE